MCSFIKNQTLAQAFFCEFSKIRKNTYFAEHHQTTACDYNSITIKIIKKLHCRCLTQLKIGFRLRVWNIELTLVPALQTKPRKCSAGKYVTQFLKRRKVFMEEQPSKAFFKKGVMRNFAELTRKHFCQNLFF